MHLFCTKKVLIGHLTWRFTKLFQHFLFIMLNLHKIATEKGFKLSAIKVLLLKCTNVWLGLVLPSFYFSNHIMIIQKKCMSTDFKDEYKLIILCTVLSHLFFLSYQSLTIIMLRHKCSCLQNKQILCRSNSFEF